jgi:hypothetical protein
MDREWLHALLLRGWDLRQILERNRQAREELHRGGTPRFLPPEIIEDHRKLISEGIDPRGKVRVRPDLEELKRRRDGHPLVSQLTEIAAKLGAGEHDDRLVALIAHDGFVLGTAGSLVAKRMADRIGLKSGLNWAGKEPGTNAVRSSVHLGRSVFMVGYQHLRLDQCGVACMSAPVLGSNRQLSAFVDLVCPAGAVNVDMPRLVDEVASNLRPVVDREHRERLDRLRQEADKLDPQRFTDGALLIDWDGWIAWAHRWDVGRRVAVPEGGFTLGRNELYGLGPVVLEPIWGGWLVRWPVPGESTPHFTVILDLRLSNPSLDRAGWIRVIGPTVSWEPHKLSLKQAEILLLLARSERDGLTQAQLAQALYPVPPAASTARSACKRVRDWLRAVLVSDPYRFDERVHVTVLYPVDKADLLRDSTAPGIIRLRQ